MSQQSLLLTFDGIAIQPAAVTLVQPNGGLTRVWVGEKCVDIDTDPETVIALINNALFQGRHPL